jgi:hypothetical protein
VRVDLRPPEIWEDLNESLRTKFFNGGTGAVQTYPSHTHALYEICEGASNFFSHKRSFGLIKGTSPTFTSLLAGFYKDGYQVQVVSVAEIKDPKAWVEGLKKDTNFVIFSSDNPLTGECMEWDTLDALLNEKKIFSLRLSHSDWLRDYKLGTLSSPRPYSASILSVNPGLSIALRGEKVKAPPVTTASLDWNSSSVFSDFQKALDHFAENESAVEALEKNPPTGWQRLPLAGSRLFDRALIYNTELNGEAVITHLSGKRGDSLPKLGGSADLEAASLCRWNGFATHYGWWDTAPSAEILRGLLILDAKLVSGAQLKASLLEADKLSRS